MASTTTTTTTITITATPAPAHYFQQLDNLKGRRYLDYKVLNKAFGPGNGTTWRSAITVEWTTLEMDQSGIAGYEFIGEGSSKPAAKEEAARQIVEVVAQWGITASSRRSL